MEKKTKHPRVSASLSAAHTQYPAALRGTSQDTVFGATCQRMLATFGMALPPRQPRMSLYSKTAAHSSAQQTCNHCWLCSKHTRIRPGELFFFFFLYDHTAACHAVISASKLFIWEFKNQHLCHTPHKLQR